MKKIINDEYFRSIIEDKRVTHSIRKIAIPRARRYGCSKDETATRACWKQKCQQDSYADTILPWPDEKVASDIYKEGPIHY